MSNRPNFLFLFTDQQRFDTIHALGNARIQTPHLDALASSSLVFDRCYTPAPVCVPARFSLFSGQYCARTGCCNNNSAHRYAGSGFYHAFTQAGYRTCCVGKMHHAADLYGPMGFENRFTQSHGYMTNNPGDNPTYGIALRFHLLDIPLHLPSHFGIGTTHGILLNLGRAVIAIIARQRQLAHLRSIGPHLDSQTCKSQLGQRTGHTAGYRLTSRRTASPPMVAHTIFASIGIIGVRGTEKLPHVVIVG